MSHFAYFYDYPHRELKMLVEYVMRQPDLALEQSAALYERYAPAVLTYLLRRVDSREDAEDLLLEVFTCVLEKGPPQREQEHALLAWILTVARNKVVDHYRRSSRFPGVPLASVEEMIYASQEREPESLLIRQEEYQQLQEAVQQLPLAQQEILHLRFGEGLRCGEIAHVLTKSEKAVRTLLYRALKRLRGIYDHEQTERSR